MNIKRFVNRHQYCITPVDVLRDVNRSGYKPKKVNVVCNFPMDGYCIHEVKDAIKDGAVDKDDWAIDTQI